MPDYSGTPANTLIFGGGSCGKTTFAYRLLLNQPGLACRFIFDEDGQTALRLKLKPCGDEAQCRAAFQSGWVCFNPYLRGRAENIRDTFRWFCARVVEWSQWGPGKKLFFVDEQWQFVDSRHIPPELERIIRTGRHHGLQYVSATHRPRDYHINIRAMVTEWVCFNTVEPAELDAVRPYYAGVDQVSRLARGEFIAYNRTSGAELRGRVF